MGRRTTARSGGRAGAFAVVLACVALGVGGGVGIKTALTGTKGDPPRAVAAATPSSSTGASADPTVSSSPSPAASAAAGFDVAVTGDMLIHQPVSRRARQDAGHGSTYDFTRMLAPIRPLIAGADLALCHAETPMSATNRDLSGYPRFRVPRELATAIRATGYEGCSTASNHTLDQGEDGVRTTLDALDAAGVGHAGSARSAAEAQTVTYYSVDGVKVAHLSYAYGFNGFQPPKGKEWLVNRIKTSAILAAAAKARTAGAQLVVVSLHWGVEYRSAPTTEQLTLAEALTASDNVDVIVGHHAHVLQPIRTVNGKLVIFGLGNLLSAQSSRAGLPAATQDGAVVIFHAEPAPGRTVAGGAARYRVSSYRAELTVVEPTTYRVQPARAAAGDPSASSALRRDARAGLAREKKVDAAYAGGATRLVASDTAPGSH